MTLANKIPVYAPVMEDVWGNTPLDVCFDIHDSPYKIANSLLNGIKDYPFLSCGFVLVSGVIKAFLICPEIGKFLDKRFVVSKHL